MNKCHKTLFGQYDFLWSTCAFKHLGSLENGIELIKNSLKSLKSIGATVHTTKFNFSSRESTLEYLGCSINLDRDILQLISELELVSDNTKILNLNRGGLSVDNRSDAPPHGLSPALN